MTTSKGLSIASSVHHFITLYAEDKSRVNAMPNQGAGAGCECGGGCICGCRSGCKCKENCECGCTCAERRKQKSEEE
jgi:hypothetical protein